VIAYQSGEGVPDSFEGVDVVVRPPPGWKARSGPAGKLAELGSVFRTVGAIDADVFVQRGTSMETGLVGLAAKAKRRRFVYSSVSTIDFTWDQVVDRKNGLLYKLGIGLADEIVVQTPEQVELCRQHFGREPVLIRSLAETARERTVQPDAFLWIGKLAAYKNPLAFVALARAVPEARFRMVAAASEKDSPELAEQVERASAGLGNLEVLAARPRSELMPLVEKAVAVVSTSDFEGMPNTFLEGWTRGVPALALAHDPDGVIEREGVGAFAGGSAERLADLTRTLWLGRHDQSQLARRCREYVNREHSPDVAAERWIQALRLGGGDRSPARVSELSGQPGGTS
jgi:glycosyltransferase involved in cell wall biosynthesis